MNRRLISRIGRIGGAVLLVTALTPLATATAAQTTVTITNTLDPKDVTIQVGDSVRWVNNDGDKHRMASLSGPAQFDIDLDPGESGAFTFNQEGVWGYIDDRNDGNANYHGTVTVTTAPPPDPGEPPPPPPNSGDVNIPGRFFSPRTLVVAEGATVTWANQDDLHNVTSTSANWSWFSGNFDAGQNERFTFSAAGNYTYYCSLHPEMTGTIQVQGAGEPPPPPAPPPPPLPPPPPPPPAGAGDVTIGDNFFDAQSFTVAEGQKVSWYNAGIIPHTVTANGGLFDSGFMGSADSYSFTFSTAGTYNYFCSFHSEMTGTILVTGAGGEPPPPPEEPPPEPPVTPPTAPPSAVKIIDNGYTPGTYTVTAGARVSWANTGLLPHTVTAIDGSFDSGLLMSGDPYARTFSTPGTFNYYCTIHPEMSGTIVVTDASGEAPPATDTGVPTDGTQDPATPAVPTDVTIVDNDFEPGSFEVAPGGTILFVNIGHLPHTVTARDASFDSGFLMPSDLYELTIDAPGSYPYFCTIHPEMVGTIVVLSPAARGDTGDGTGAATGATDPPPTSGSDGTSAPADTSDPGADGEAGPAPTDDTPVAIAPSSSSSSGVGLALAGLIVLAVIAISLGMASREKQAALQP